MGHTTAADKKKMLLKIYHTKKEPFNLKELTKLAKAAGLAEKLVQDVNTQLMDDNYVSSDKIGTGNYFWAFPGSQGAQAKKQLEEARAAARPFQLEHARAGFESNPFRWKRTDGEWFSQKQVGFLWSWQCRGQLRYSVVVVRANHLFEEDRHIPRPEALKGPWEIWQSRLEDAASARAVA